MLQRGLRRYLILCLIAIIALSGCESLGIGATPQPTPLPFNRFTAESVFTALAEARLEIQNLQRDMLIGRDAPSTFADRYIFEIPRIAPSGGQILVFNTPADLAEWETYVNQLRADPETRREVVYVYTNSNIMLQVNANLTPAEADAFRVALLEMD